MTRTRILIAAIVLVAAAAAFAFRISTSMADFEVYWRGAVRAAAAEPLYRADDGHFQFKYLPAFAVLTIPLGLLPLPVAKAAWFALSVALLCLLVWLSVELLPERRTSPGLLVVVVVIVLGKFFAHELVLGQANILFGVLATAAIALLPVAVYGFDGAAALHRAWWNTVTETTPSNLTNPDNVSFAGLWVKWLGSGAPATWLAAVTSVGALAAAVFAFARRRGLAFPEALEGSLLLMLVPLLSPQGWDYVLLLAAPAIALLANYADRLPTGLRAATIIAALTMGLSLFDLMGRRAYSVFMGLAVISVCASVLITALCVMRLRKIA